MIYRHIPGGMPSQDGNDSGGAVFVFPGVTKGAVSRGKACI